MPLAEEERRRLIERYAQAPERLRGAIDAVPKEARKWRPAEGKWSAHEVVCHCGDAEIVAAQRLRYLVCESDPVVQAYDQDRWSRELRYHDVPLEPSLECVAAVHAHTANLLRALPDDAWGRSGRHSEGAAWDVDRWLSIYGEHVHKHAAQIDRNLAAWRAASAR